MKTDTREMTVGAATLAVGGLLLAVLYVGGEVRDKATGIDYLLDATFNRIDGLADGGDVRLGGIKVGVVESQRLDEHYRAVLTLKIDSDVQLPTDTSAAIHTNGLFGAKYIVLEPGGEDEILAEGDEISFTQDAVIVSELLELIISQGKANRRKLREKADAADKRKE